MLKEAVDKKVKEWFGSSCSYKILNEDDGCAQVFVYTSESDEPTVKGTFTLARILQLGNNVEISVDFDLDTKDGNLDFEEICTLFEKVQQFQ